MSEIPCDAAVPEKNPVSSDASPDFDTASAGLLAVSAVTAAAYAFGHQLFGPFLPGIGLTVSHWILVISALLYARAKGRLQFRHRGPAILLLALAVMLSACYGIFANNRLRWMNLPALSVMSCQAVFSLTGQLNEENPLSFRGLRAGSRLLIPSLFMNWRVPLKALTARSKKRRGTGAEVMLGLLIAIPVLTIALMLLTGADSVFGSLLQSALSAFLSTDGSAIPKLILAFLLSLTLFSWLFCTGIPHEVTPRPVTAAQQLPVVTFGVVLALLDLVYAAFAAVQVRYLLLGTESVRMAGGYAEYARSGFFQLVILAILTLLMILPLLSALRHSRAIRTLCALTALLTVAIDCSAFYRMHMYIGAYGLSFLRVLTLWAMAMILLALAATMIKAVHPAVRICPALAAILFTTWVALNMLNVDRIVAEQQVARLNAGMTDQQTIIRLVGELSPDAIPAYGHILSETDRRAAETAVHTAFGPAAVRPDAYDWALTWNRAEPAE